MASSYKFQGWIALDKESAKGNMVWQEYEPKAWTEDDVDIKITHCGICGSDLHTLRSGWGATNYPACVGHEVAGTAVKPECEECASGLENHCTKMVGTYNGIYPDGSKSYGGYADYCRAPSHFVIKIPDGLSLVEAAPMLCGGITTWSPLVNNGAGPSKRVGIVGIGGLGHFGLLWARVWGAKRSLRSPDQVQKKPTQRRWVL
ncbi:hypothetical protein DID88_009432 [Monilinia fructigena]|uniref:Alcohol dehydrogenase-like N-terminal domain-containing protein n=1 Tax=Monilinia fructigena TaxID=38457 RepID=A0A395IME4_9HELO|nr:hypothetical protein DID88_009432 [Monilinia fructigena]